MTKRIIKLSVIMMLLPILLCSSIYEASAFTLDDGYQLTYNGTLNDNIEWFVDRKANTMTISGTGPIPDYADADDCPLYLYRTMVTNLIIEDGITDIGDYAFTHAHYSNITLGKDITRIGKNAFYYSKVQNINLSGKLTVIDSSAFSQCVNLTELSFPDGLIEIGADCFFGCSNLAKYSIPNSVTTIGKSAFHGTAIESITIPDGITTIEEGTFAHCEKLEKVNLGKGLTTIGQLAFRYCPIEIINITNSVTTIEYGAFWPCSELKTIILPTSVTTIEEKAFWNTSLEDVYYSGTPEQYATISIGNTNDLPSATIHYNYNPELYEDLSIKTENNILTVSGSDSVPETDGNNTHPWDKYAETATAIIIDGNITTIGSNAFSNFSNISTIIICTPSITIAPNAFVNCPCLENVIILGNSDFKHESFSGCSATINVFENTEKQHSLNKSEGNINILSFTCKNNAINLSGSLLTNAYNFFDIIAAFCDKYDAIKYIKVDKFTSKDITFYRYDEANYTYVPIEGNTLENASFSVFLDSYETGRVEITFNQLCDGISDGSITDFYLVATDEKNDDVLDTEIEVKDEEEENFFERALKWIVSLLNKLFKLFSRL